jgi:hypothetical protein
MYNALVVQFVAVWSCCCVPGVIEEWLVDKQQTDDTESIGYKAQTETGYALDSGGSIT